MKLFGLRENKLGMTLVEMVISLVILGILTTSTMGMVISSNNIFISTSKSAIDKQVGNYAFDFIEKVLRYTTHMSIYDQSEASRGTNIQSISLNVSDDANNAGKLMYKRADGSEPFNLYDDSFYGGRSIQYSVHKVGNNSKHVKLKLTVFREGRAVYSRESVVKCLNLNLVAIGDGANPLVDKSSADAVNQFITFSVDEKLLSGGKNAFSLEYKVAEYMAKYNKIQNDYVTDINKAYGKYINGNYNDETNPGIKGTALDYNKRVTSAAYASRLDKVTNIIFGNGSDYYVYDKDNIDNCVNLRAEYQRRVNELLKFTLKDSNGAQFTNGNITNNTIAGTAYKLHSGDEYFGVVATKEELYTGFMLTYYDKDKNGVITKAEYPQFEGDSFFQGTSMGSYVQNTSDNQMVIMTYFKDNVANDNYKALVVKTNADVHSFSGSYTPGVKPAAPVSTNKSFSVSNESYGSKRTSWGNTSYTYDAFNPTDKNRVYRFWSDQDYYFDANNKCESSKSGSTYTNTGLENYLTSKATNITPNLNVTSIISGSNYNSTQNPVYTASQALPEGWYLTKIPYYSASLAANTKYCYSVFYLAAAQTGESDVYDGLPLNPNKIAVPAGGTVRFNLDEDRPAAFPIYYRFDDITYTQARFTGEQTTDGAEFTTQTTFKTFTAHQYGDYVLYGVDWNSWFNSTPQGLLNRVLTGVSNFINTIFGRTVNTNITQISGANAVQSLGNIGQHNVNVNDGTVASYNLAWVVYSPKRGTWYYVPAQSTRISGAISSVGWMSSKDQPVPLDADLDNGTWKNGGSSALVSDIEKRKMSSSGFFGLVDTTSDVMWVALPTGNTINPSDLVDD